MNLLLPIPVIRENQIINCVELKKPRTMTTSKAYKAAQKGNVFKSMFEFAVGCIDSMTDIEGNIITENKVIRNICFEMPLVSAETICLKAMCMMSDDDTIEGVYTCPRCKTEIITGDDSDYEPERIGDLDIVVMDEKQYTEQNLITIDLDHPVNIINKKNKEVLYNVDTLTIVHPVMKVCIQAGVGLVEGEEVEAQLKMYQNSIVAINGESVSQSFIDSFGKILLDKMLNKDVNKLGSVVYKYGIVKRIERECYRCGKKWKPTLNTSGFFVLGLQ